MSLDRPTAVNNPLVCSSAIRCESTKEERAYRSAEGRGGVRLETPGLSYNYEDRRGKKGAMIVGRKTVEGKGRAKKKARI